MRRFLTLLTASLILSGCSGSIYTALMPTKENNNETQKKTSEATSGTTSGTTNKDNEEKVYKGVLVHPIGMFKDVYQTTSLVNKDGKLLGHSSQKTKENYNEWIKNGAKEDQRPAVIYCVPLEYQKLVIRPDFDKQYRVWYEPGLLETHEFGLELENGAIVSINSKGTPDRGQTAKTLAETAATGAGLLFSLDVFEEHKKLEDASSRTIVTPSVCNHGEQLVKTGQPMTSDISDPDLPSMEFNSQQSK